MNLQKERTYLVVPFAERKQAHNLGAHWDEAAGAWYVPASSNHDHVRKWLPIVDATPAAPIAKAFPSSGAE